MSERWTNHLLSRGAVFLDGRVTQFGATDQVASNAICDLSHYGVLKVSGDDAEAFLHAQLTNDVKLLAEDSLQWNGWCTPKGRLIATFLVHRHAGAFYLQFARALLPAIHKRLGMFVLRAKAKIEDVSDERARFAVLGVGAVKQLCAQLGSVSPSLQASYSGTVSVLQIDAARAVISAPPEEAATHWLTHVSSATEVGAAHWDLANIRAGIVDVWPQTQDQFVPQMANFDLIGGVSFKKGCYPGQEIVARTQYRGILKRRMARVALPLEGDPKLGDPIYAPQFGDQVAGQIALVARVGEMHEALVVAQREAIAADQMALDDTHQRRIMVLPLPYEIPS